MPLILLCMVIGSHSTTACLAAEHVSQETTVKQLMLGLSAPDPRSRLEAVLALGEMGPAALLAAPALVEYIRSEPLRDDYNAQTDYGAIQAARESLVAMGPIVIPVLVETLGDPDTDADLAMVLAELGPPAVPALVQVLRAEDGRGSEGQRPAEGRVHHAREDPGSRPERIEHILVEQVPALEEEGELLPVDIEHLAPLHIDDVRRGQTLRVLPERILPPRETVDRRPRQPAAELIDDRRAPLVLILQTERDVQRVPLIPVERHLLRRQMREPLRGHPEVRVGGDAVGVGEGIRDLAAHVVAAALFDADLQAAGARVRAVDEPVRLHAELLVERARRRDEAEVVLREHHEIRGDRFGELVGYARLIRDGELLVQIGIPDDAGAVENVLRLEEEVAVRPLGKPPVMEMELVAVAYRERESDARTDLEFVLVDVRIDIGAVEKNLGVVARREEVDAHAPVHDHALVLPFILYVVGGLGIEVVEDVRAEALRVRAVADGQNPAGERQALLVEIVVDELRARLRALLRRNSEDKATILTAADLALDPATRTVTRAGQPIELTTREYALLEYFLRNPNRVISREEAENHIWSYDFMGVSNVIDVYIRRLRAKIDDPYELKLIETMRGVGYRLVKP